MADEPGTAAAPAAPTEPAAVPASQDKTFTQAELDRIVEDRLGRERKKYDGFDAIKAKADRLDEIEAANQSELEKAQGKTTKAERERDEAKALLLRYEVATEKDVPAKLVPLLTGTTREQLEAQAGLILDNAKPADPDFDGGPREPAPPAQTPAEAHDAFIAGLLTGKSQQ